MKVIRDMAIFCILLGFLVIIIKASVPFYWGNELMTQKMQYLLEEKKDYNSYFIGSSTVYRHYNPVVFDEITKTNSFNLGCSGMMALETNYILENFIKRLPEKSNPNIYVQELEPFYIFKHNQHTVRAKYFMDYKRLKIGVKYFFKEKNYVQVYRHIVNYIENLLGIGELLPILEFHLLEKKELNKLVKQQRGYYGLDQQLTLEKEEELKVRKEDYQELVRTGKSRKRKKSELKIVPLANQVIKVSLPETNNQVSFYQIVGTPIITDSMYFDFRHLTSEGANIFTEIVANKIVKKEQ